MDTRGTQRRRNCLGDTCRRILDVVSRGCRGCGGRSGCYRNEYVVSLAMLPVGKYIVQFPEVSSTCS
ncbi:uncharacterized protein LOC143149813 isoform X3 [Ptiloglossa arizonensis]|uniref:uncharacterized protein LOC143149813 isoform X3 n=1 Tax=Ptiloglossa arizonensis TaxID=3350558 RepID=UPI003F9F42B0